VTKIDPDLPGEVPDQIDGDFKFENIEFTYPARPSQPIFTGKFNLEGKRNQTIALVGQSGCGKSTTIGMIQRWYDANGGTVSVDGKDVRRYQLRDGLRKNMALVSQEPVLFDMSVRENILAGTGRVDVTDEELDQIAQMANVYNFIKDLPEGYGRHPAIRYCSLSCVKKSNQNSNYFFLQTRGSVTRVAS